MPAVDHFHYDAHEDPYAQKMPGLKHAPYHPKDDLVSHVRKAGTNIHHAADDLADKIDHAGKKVNFAVKKTAH